VAGGARGGLFRLDFRLQLRLDGGVDDGVRGVLGQVARPHRLAAQLPPILVHLGLRGWTGLGSAGARHRATALQNSEVERLKDQTHHVNCRACGKEGCQHHQSEEIRLRLFGIGTWTKAISLRFAWKDRTPYAHLDTTD